MVNPIAASTRSWRSKYFADWTDRIAKGELPHAPPPRPQGVERNLVITEWDWGWPTAYLHDLISTDKRNPTVNANGKEYGSTENSPTTSRSSIRRPIRSRVSSTGARPEHAAVLGRTAPKSPRPIGATGRSGIRESTTTTR